MSEAHARSYTGYTNDQIDAPYDLFACVTYCHFCPDWAHTGTAAEGREAARAHRAEAHPEIREKRRRRANYLRVASEEQVKAAAVRRRASKTRSPRTVMTLKHETKLLGLYREGYPVSTICRMRWKRMGYSSAESLESSFYRMLRRRGIPPERRS